MLCSLLCDILVPHQWKDSNNSNNNRHSTKVLRLPANQPAYTHKHSLKLALHVWVCALHHFFMHHSILTNIRAMFFFRVLLRRLLSCTFDRIIWQSFYMCVFHRIIVYAHEMWVFLLLFVSSASFRLYFFFMDFFFYLLLLLVGYVFLLAFSFSRIDFRSHFDNYRFHRVQIFSFLPPPLFDFFCLQFQLLCRFKYNLAFLFSAAVKGKKKQLNEHNRVRRLEMFRSTL